MRAAGRALALLAGVALAAAAVLALVGRGSAEPALPAATPTPTPTAAPSPRPAATRRVRCPTAVAGCVSVRGRVALVEAVDPDGDGDLHVVLLAGNVTAPGVTAVDIRPGLRPRRDPRVGDVVSAAGPVQRGSFGQSQIHAVRVAFPGQRAE